MKSRHIKNLHRMKGKETLLNDTLNDIAFLSWSKLLEVSNNVMLVTQHYRSTCILSNYTFNALHLVSLIRQKFPI